MKANLMVAVLIVAMFTVGGLYTNCGQKAAEDDTSVGTVSTVPLPTFGFTCTTACSSLTVGNSYDVYVMFVSATCAASNTNSTVAAKGKVSASYTNAGLSTVLNQVTWANNATSIAVGKYAMLSWIDRPNTAGQMDVGELYQCQDITVQGASIGNQTFSNYSASTSSQSAPKY